MIEAKHLLVDTNVWLDYYLQEGAFDEARRLVELAEAGKIDLLYAPTTAKDVFYLLPRRLARRNVNGMNVSFASASSPAEREWDERVVCLGVMGLH